MTLLLTASQITRYLGLDTALAALRTGFTAAPAGPRPLRTHTALPGPGSATALLPGLIDDIPAYTVKVNAKFPGATPALRGVVCLHDLADGALLAVLDSATVTAWRTGLAAALATHVLAPAGADRVSIIGAGAQARMVLRGLGRLRAVRRLTVHDIDPERAAAFASEQGRLLGIAVDVAADPPSAAAGGGIVVLATWSRTPLLDLSDLRPGTHITSLGVDEPGKAELADDLLREARTVVDDLELAQAVGTLQGHGPVADATFGEVLRGERPGREDDTQLTAYTPVGLPWQDLALAWPIYQAARAAGDAPSVDFLA
ncbi:ornithine cyclodeaminase family protein [Streptomyces sp. NPDC059008]|uniref:ornithine cyclodeaminase family protein n=1 Tax=Streptomyces sp. NPDC059008 TaxID=3346693 RepID=UPI00368EA523